MLNKAVAVAVAVAMAVAVGLIAEALSMSHLLTVMEHTLFCVNKSRPHYCFDHIACKTALSVACGEVRSVPSSVAELIVDVHNDCRDRATTLDPHEPPERFVTYPRLGNLPSSAGLMQLSWDEELADMASMWVSSCGVKFEAMMQVDPYPDAPPPVRGQYQNYHYTGNRSGRHFPFCFDVSRFPVKGWVWITRARRGESMYSQWRALLWEFCSDVSRTLPQYIIESYRPPELSLGAFFREEGVCMLWATAARVGCGQRLPDDDESYDVRYGAMACLYGPAPLQMGERVYEVGEPGSWCPPQAPAAAARWPHLCVPQGSPMEMALIATPVAVALVLGAACFMNAPRF